MKRYTQEFVDFINILNEECNTMNQNWDINCGGCCFLAYCIAENCEKLNLEYSIKIYDSDCENILNNLQNTKTACYHVSIIIEGLEINGYSDFNFIKGKTNSNIIRRWYKKSYWNPIYNKHYNGIVHKQINKIFKNYEKERKNFS